MNSYKIKLILCFVFFIWILNTSYAKENKILIKIDNNIITSLDILDEIKYLKIVNKEILDKVEGDHIYEVAKNSLLREKIKEIELLKHINKIEIEEKYFKTILINYFKKYNINSELEFEEYFFKYNLDPENIKKKLTIEILWNQLIYKKFHKNVKIDKDSIAKKISNSKNINEYLLSEIVFNINQTENSNEKYLKIKDRIDNSSFSEAALFFSISSSASNGGNLGWIKETSIDKKILRYINLIDIGDLTEPIIIPGGFLIIKVEDKKVSKIENDIEREFDLAVKKITNNQLNQFSNIYFNKIKKNVQINEL